MVEVKATPTMHAAEHDVGTLVDQGSVHFDDGINPIVLFSLAFLLQSRLLLTKRMTCDADFATALAHSLVRCDGFFAPSEADTATAL